jgi:hypothetical protein
MLKQWALILLLAVAVPVTAAEYQIRQVPLLPTGSYPARTSLGGVTVAADPYGTDDKSFTAFDIRDLNTRGYFPVHVVIENATAGYVTLRTRNIMLVTASGRELYTTSATVLVDDIFKGALVPKLPKKSRDSSSSIKTGSPLLDFSEKELTNRQIAPGTVAHGFLFFFSGDIKNLLVGSGLRIPDMTDDSRKPIGPVLINLDAAATQASPLRDQ